MKNICSLLFFSLTTTINAQIISFQDVNLKNALVNTICVDSNGDGGVDSDADINNDGEIDQTEALLVTFLSVNYSNLNSLSGIEYFSNLISLNCYNNNLTNLDLSSLSNLTDINCSYNQLTSLNINNLSNLMYLKCESNQLTNINFENHPNLTYAICSYNLFTELNICGTAISIFWCNDNPNLQYLTLKNGVISNLNTNKKNLTPPPLPVFNLYNLPALNALCYDEGELPEITFFTSGFNPNGVTLTTDCPTNCLLENTTFKNSTVKIYPNPAKDKLYFESDSITSINQIEVYTMLGQLVLSESQTSDTFISMDVNGLNSGTYLIYITTTKGSEFTKLIKL